MASTSSSLHTKQELKKNKVTSINISGEKSLFSKKLINHRQKPLQKQSTSCEKQLLYEVLSLHTQSLVSRVKKRPKGTSNRCCSNDNIR